MRQAAVGFQCPDCVAEGRKSTRSWRTPYGGGRSGNPARTSQVLIAINVLVWLLVTATGGGSSPWLFRLALLPVAGVARVGNGQVERFAGVADGAYWQPLTSMFVHVDPLHIGFNMLALWFLGPQLEAAVGRARFLTLYLVSGLIGSVFVYWLTPVNTPTVGASGAVFGLLGALLVIAIKVRADLSQLLVWIGLNFVITVLGRGYISWQGHLGGFIGGALIALVYAYSPRARRSVWQAVGLALLVAAVVAAFVARTATLT
jgi:membrane associated rhomboid family serine protease